MRAPYCPLGVLVPSFGGAERSTPPPPPPPSRSLARSIERARGHSSERAHFEFTGRLASPGPVASVPRWLCRGDRLKRDIRTRIKAGGTTMRRTEEVRSGKGRSTERRRESERKRGKVDGQRWTARNQRGKERERGREQAAPVGPPPDNAGNYCTRTRADEGSNSRPGPFRRG